MAGSWNHMTAEDGKLLNNENFSDLIENGGDAYEAAEQCFGMVQWLAQRLSNNAGGSRRYWVEQAQKNIKGGLELGGVQEE